MCQRCSLARFFSHAYVPFNVLLELQYKIQYRVMGKKFLVARARELYNH